MRNEISCLWAMPAATSAQVRLFICSKMEACYFQAASRAPDLSAGLQRSGIAKEKNDIRPLV